MVSKKPALSGQPKGQVWLLDGGPGGDGSYLAPYFEYVVPEVAEDYDLYVVTHRGTGISEPLECTKTYDLNLPQEQAFSNAERDCIAELEARYTAAGLNSFSATDAARDVEHLIGKSKAGEWLPTYVYGISYGTLWGQRLSQIAPHSAQGFILDSILPSKGYHLDNWDRDHNEIFSTHAAACDADPECANKFDGPTEQAVLDIINGVDSGEICPSLDMTGEDLKANNGWYVMTKQPDILFPMYHRIQRCDDVDIKAVHNALLFSASQVESDNTVSEVENQIFNVIAFNEIADGAGFTAAEQAAYCENKAVCGPNIFEELGDLQEAFWKDRYNNDFIYEWPVNYTPTLVLNGTVDPQTPHYRIPAYQNLFTTSNQQYVEFDNVAHGVIWDTPTLSNGNTCGGDIVAQFINDPWTPVDATCTNDLPELNMQMAAEDSLEIFGSISPWQSDAPAAPMARGLVEQESTRADIQQAIETLKQHPRRF